MAWYVLKSIFRIPPPLTKNEETEAKIRSKNKPQTTCRVEADAQSVHKHNDQIVDLKFYNLGKIQSIISNDNTYSSFTKITPF